MAYKKALAAKIKGIFGLSQVVFGVPTGTKTQNCAWVLPNPTTESISGDRRTCFVTGEIIIINPLDVMPVGRLYEKYALSKDRHQGVFRITSRITEGFEHGANQLTAHKFDFIFEITEQYNPPKKMKGLRWIYKIIGKEKNV